MDQRHQTIVDKKLQFHYFWLWILVATGVVAVIAIFELSQYTEKMRMDKEIAYVLKKVFWVTGAYILILSIVFGAYTIFHLHRVAGPVYRLNRSVEAMLRGELDQTIQLRQKDYFQDLAVNLDTLRHRMLAQRQELSAIQGKLSASGQTTVSEDLARILAKTQGASSESGPGL